MKKKNWLESFCHQYFIINNETKSKCFKFQISEYASTNIILLISYCVGYMASLWNCFHPGSSPPVSKSISIWFSFPNLVLSHDLQLQPNSVIFDENSSFIQIEEGSQVVKINRLCRTHSQRKHKHEGLQIQMQIQMQIHFYISNGRHTSASLSPLFISSKYQQQQQRVGWPHGVTFGHIYSPIFIYIHHPIYISIFI